KRRDVRTDQVARHHNSVRGKDLCDLVVHEVQLDKWRPAEAVYKRDHPIAAAEREVGQDRLDEQRGYLFRRRERRPTAPRLTGNAGAPLHLSLPGLEGRV